MADGAAVTAQLLYSIESDKSVQEIEAPATGTRQDPGGDPARWTWWGRCWRRSRKALAGGLAHADGGAARGRRKETGAAVGADSGLLSRVGQLLAWINAAVPIPVSGPCTASSSRFWAARLRFSWQCRRIPDGGTSRTAHFVIGFPRRYDTVAFAVGGGYRRPGPTLVAQPRAVNRLRGIIIASTGCARISIG